MVGHPGAGRGAVEVPDGRGGWRRVAEAGNAWCYTWGDVVARLCLPDRTLDYRPAVLYVEFRNDGAPAAAVADPRREDGLAYYLALEADPTRDYLRVPIVERTPGRDEGYAGTDGLPADAFNSLTLSGVSAATVGVFGRPFSAAAGSLVYGSAVAAAPFPDDPARDVVWARAVYPAADQFRPIAGAAVVRATHVLYFR